MGEISSIGAGELIKYIALFIAIVNALIAYIFTNFKKAVEIRLDALEARYNEDHDVLRTLKAEHRLYHTEGVNGRKL